MSKLDASSLFASGFFSSRRTTPNAKVDLPAGVTLCDGRFGITQYLGSGSFGSVYKADETVHGGPVALKVVRVDGTEVSAYAQTALRHELRVYRGLRSVEGLLRIHDLFECEHDGEKLLLLSMEFADGGSLRERMDQVRRNGQNGVAARRELFKQVCEALALAHESGLVHRDVKPGNCLFVNGRLKLSDFGWAKCANNAEANKLLWREDHVFLPGTPVYSPPEQFQASYPDDLDERSDVYSAGVIGYEIFNPKGRPPFAGSYERLRDLHVNVSPPALPHDGLPEARVIAKCLEKDSARRYRNARELFNDLAKCNSHPVGQEKPKAGSKPPAHARKANSAYQKARQYMTEGDYDRARRWCKTAIEHDPRFKPARLLLEEIQSKYELAERYYEGIESVMDKTDLRGKSDLLRVGEDIYPNHPRFLVQESLLRVQSREYRRAAKAAKKRFKSGDLTSAMIYLKKAALVDPRSPHIVAAAHRVYLDYKEEQERRGLPYDPGMGLDWDGPKLLE